MNPVIGVEGHWEVRDAVGELIDNQMETANRDAYRIHVLLGKTVEGFSVDPPESFTILFESGHSLTVFDQSKMYESFSVQPGDWFI